jgi:hypothetical protein
VLTPRDKLQEGHIKQPSAVLNSHLFGLPVDDQARQNFLPKLRPRLVIRTGNCRKIYRFIDQRIFFERSFRFLIGRVASVVDGFFSLHDFYLYKSMFTNNFVSFRKSYLHKSECNEVVLTSSYTQKINILLYGKCLWLDND